MRSWSPLPIEWQALFIVASWLRSIPSGLYRSLTTYQQQPAWQQLLSVIALGLGIAYAYISLVSEYHYALGASSSTQLIEQIGQLRAAKSLNPFEPRIRTGPGRMMGLIAVAENNKQWYEAALPELELALQTDYTDPAVLIKLIQIEMALGHTEQAQRYYDQFKRVDRASPLIKFVGQLHEQGSLPSLPTPDGVGVTK